ncbi:zinc finger CCCH domain-containing protein 11A isoform X2 [Orussus abietinus]|nr:zinc finger CCCH domain-containing protein 11A isoform X2 [Orussus abietinus]
MESTQKSTDCYFFYYSTCIKGDNCAFRHEPAALGCETMCSYWQQGNCLNEHCNFRHMELKKNRKMIPCYWETQPSGCRKPHCSFLHKKARTINDPINPVKPATKPANPEWSNRPDDTKFDGSSTESDQGRGSSEASSFIGSPVVDPLIVQFEEESDNESVPSPIKPQSRVPYCKTYEEIRLEEIQAESAAYYSYEPDDFLGEPGGGKVKTMPPRASRRPAGGYERDRKRKRPETEPEGKTSSLDFGVLSLEEIKRRRRRAEDQPEREFLKSAVKTLAELKAAAAVGQLTGDHVTGDHVTEGPYITGRATKVPPVRLRRSPRRFLLDRAPAPPRDPEEASQTDGAVERFQDAANAGRGAGVEVRLCDSSTDDAHMALVDDVAPPAQDVKMGLPCDSLLVGAQDEDYMTFDTPSDDILKDIDALLKDRNAV